MSRITELQEPQHFIVEDEKVKERFHKLITEHGLPVHRSLTLHDLSYHNFPPQIFINCNFSGIVSDNVLANSVFFETIFSGKISKNNFRESDLIGGSLSGDVITNKFQGAYLRYVNISDAVFSSGTPLVVDQTDNSIQFHQTTGRIIFCSGVENSMLEPEDIATFRKITIHLTEGKSMDFLARLYFDGTHKKLGLIPQKTLTTKSGTDEARLWGKFIYTLTNTSAPIRSAIEADIMRDAIDLPYDELKILPPKEYTQNGPISLRPARPIDMTLLTTFQHKLHDELKEFFFEE